MLCYRSLTTISVTAVAGVPDVGL